jgi:hypothetical protein
MAAVQARLTAESGPSPLAFLDIGFLEIASKRHCPYLFGLLDCGRSVEAPFRLCTPREAPLPDRTAFISCPQDSVDLAKDLRNHHEFTNGLVAAFLNGSRPDRS